MKNILITICARGGSKGIPGKNIKTVNKKPLISYTINHAIQFAEKYNAEIELSTDSEEIKKNAAMFGVKTNYTRPDHLAGDNVGKIDAIKDLLVYAEKFYNSSFDCILDLDVTSPLRNIEDLSAGFEILLQDKEALNLFSVNRASRSPYFNMVEENKSGYFQLVKEPISDVLSRQNAPQVYELNASFYFYRRKFFDLNINTAITKHSLIYKMPHICFDLDEPIDFEFLSFLMANNKLDFSL